MRAKQRFGIQFFLVVGFVGLFFLYQYRASVRERGLLTIEQLKIYWDNFLADGGTDMQRHRPLSVVKRETELALQFGPPFRDFSPQDWKEFWNLIYGTFPRTDPEHPDLPARQRQLTNEELANALVELYPQPFSLYGEQEWQRLLGALSQR